MPTERCLAIRIKKKLSLYSERIIGEYRCGFRSGRSVRKQVFTLKQIQAKSHILKLPTHVLFIDFKQACDTIKKRKLYEALQQLGIPIKLVRWIEMTMRITENTVIINGLVSKKFECKNSLRRETLSMKHYLIWR